MPGGGMNWLQRVDIETAIIGAGFSGLCMAIELKKAGKNSFVIFESAGDVGGTWRDNTYPGCACDVATPVYSFSFEPNPDWTWRYGPQKEIWQYMRHCADKYGVRPYCRFNTRIKSAAWNEHDQIWDLTTSTGEAVRARHVVSGIGLLRIPSYPKLEGIENFKGKTFHSSR